MILKRYIISALLALVLSIGLFASNASAQCENGGTVINVTYTNINGNDRVQGITVQLHETNGYVLVDTEITDSNGQVSFTGLDTCKEYSVGFVQTSLWVTTYNFSSMSLQPLSSLASDLQLYAAPACNYGYSTLSGEIYDTYQIAYAQVEVRVNAHPQLEIATIPFHAAPFNRTVDWSVGVYGCIEYKVDVVNRYGRTDAYFNSYNFHEGYTGITTASSNKDDLDFYKQ